MTNEALWYRHICIYIYETPLNIYQRNQYYVFHTTKQTPGVGIEVIIIDIECKSALINFIPFSLFTGTCDYMHDYLSPIYEIFGCYAWENDSPNLNLAKKEKKKKSYDLLV